MWHLAALDQPPPTSLQHWQPFDERMAEAGSASRIPSSRRHLFFDVCRRQSFFFKPTDLVRGEGEEKKEGK
jgi:hypothetical protein